MTRKLLPLSDVEKFEVVLPRYWFYLHKDYEFNFQEIALGRSSRYIGYKGDNFDDIEDLVYNGALYYGFKLSPLIEYLDELSKDCAAKEMYSLAFNLQNIKCSIEKLQNNFNKHNEVQL